MGKIIKISLVLLIAYVAVSCLFGKVNIDSVNSGDEMITMKKAEKKPLIEVKETATVIEERIISKDSVKKKVIKKIEPVKKDAKVSKAPVAANKETVDSLIAKIKASQAKRKGLKTKIRIETKYTDFDMVQMIRGEVIIRKKDKFRIKYTEPAEQMLVSNGVTLWVYTPMLGQVIMQDVNKANLNMQFYIEIENSIGYFAKYSETKMTQEKDYYEIHMKPDKKKIQYDEITVKVEKGTLLPMEMSMLFDNSFVKVVFSETKAYTTEAAAKLDFFKDTYFEFKIPEGAEVIDGADLMGQ